MQKRGGDYCENFQKELNFNPKIFIEDRVKRFIDWFKEYHKM